MDAKPLGNSRDLWPDGGPAASELRGLVRGCDDLPSGRLTTTPLGTMATSREATAPNGARMGRSEFLANDGSRVEVEHRIAPLPDRADWSDVVAQTMVVTAAVDGVPVAEMHLRRGWFDERASGDLASTDLWTHVRPDGAGLRDADGPLVEAAMLLHVHASGRRTGPPDVVSARMERVWSRIDPDIMFGVDRDGRRRPVEQRARVPLPPPAPLDELRAQHCGRLPVETLLRTDPARADAIPAVRRAARDFDRRAWKCYRDPDQAVLAVVRDAVSPAGLETLRTEARTRAVLDDVARAQSRPMLGQPRAAVPEDVVEAAERLRAEVVRAVDEDRAEREARKRSEALFRSSRPSVAALAEERAAVRHERQAGPDRPDMRPR